MSFFLIFTKLSNIILPLGVTHVAGLHELLVHCEGAREVMLGLAVLGDLEVVAEHLAILGSHTVIDDLLGTLTRTLATQIGYTLLGDDDLHRVLGVIEVRYHRYDGRDSAVLRGGSRRKDRKVRVAREVARSADTVHHLRAANMRRVDVSVDIRLESGVDSDDAETTSDLRAVGCLLRTK